MDEQLKPFAEAVGEMCNEWAHLEQWVTRLFLSIGGWDYKLITTLTMSNCLDRRDQIKAAKIGAMIRCPPGDFLDAVIGSLDYIDNYLRNTLGIDLFTIFGLRRMKISLRSRLTSLQDPLFLRLLGLKPFNIGIT